MIAPLTEPLLNAPAPAAPTPAAAPPVTLELVSAPRRLFVPASVLLMDEVLWVALELWLVVALGLTVTLLFGMALKSVVVLTEVSERGATRWLASVLVLLPARLVVRPSARVPDPVVPACVLLVVPVLCVADVVWLVVPLGLMVTLLFGIALKLAPVFTEVLALGVADWVVLVLVSLPAALLACARAEPLEMARTAAAMRLTWLLIM